MTYLKRFKEPLLGTHYIWLALFVITALAVNLVLVDVNRSSLYEGKFTHSFGGPINLGNDQLALVGLSVFPVQDLASDNVGREQVMLLVDAGAGVGISQPVSNLIPTRDGLKKYKVSEGDSLSEIAARFGISVDTIRFANPGIKNVISPGEEIVILPVSGLLYEIEPGDTLEGVSARYRIDPSLVKSYNSDYQKLFESPGATVILPYAKPLNRWAYLNKYEEGLPVLNNYFKLPARGWNWGELHYNNAVDIAAVCGETIYAAQEGLVAEESSNNRWNEGYGNYLLIEHPNGTKTKYSHTLKNLVSKDEYVLQGEEIALIGNSGNTHGPTGCHLHFEVQGAQNPFAVR